MSFANKAEELCLDFLTGNAATAPTALYLALFKADPTDANTAGTEVDSTTDDAAYERQLITFDAAVAGSGKALSNIDVMFAAASAAYAVTHAGLFDDTTAGNLIASGAFPVSIPRLMGNSLTISAGQYSINLD